VTAAAKADTEAALLRLIDAEGAERVVLARSMRILSDDLCRRLHGRAINIHDPFLPGFRGARPYRQARGHGVKIIGATANYATDDLNERPIIEQDVARADHAMDAAAPAAIGRDVQCMVPARAVQQRAAPAARSQQDRRLQVACAACPDGGHRDRPPDRRQGRRRPPH
jgi:formyltetrahydrofolate deformylase